MAMMDQFKEGIEQALGSLSEGWRELSQRATGALTRFKPSSATADDSGAGHGDLPATSGWAFMAADVFEDAEKVVVRLEAPGMRRDDFNVELSGHTLSVRGEKRFQRESDGGRYRVVQCAYGSFRREILLPAPVQADKTRATYRDGVLRIEMPKAAAETASRVDVHDG
jgi:HSP20 family protein